jgi:hypothetical protein
MKVCLASSPNRCMAPKRAATESTGGEAEGRLEYPDHLDQELVRPFLKSVQSLVHRAVRGSGEGQVFDFNPLGQAGVRQGSGCPSRRRALRPLLSNERSNGALKRQVRSREPNGSNGHDTRAERPILRPGWDVEGDPLKGVGSPSNRGHVVCLPKQTIFPRCPSK